MSDEIKKTEMTSEEAFSAEIKRRLAEPDSGKPSLEEFKLMVYKDRERRRKKRNAAVAGIVVALLAGFFAFDTLVPEVGADKNPKEEIITEDGVIIEDGGWGSSEEEDNVWVVDDWNQISDVKESYPQIMIPEYLPQKYIFQTLEVEVLGSGDLTYRYVFLNKSNNEKLEIEIIDVEEGEVSTSINQEYRELLCTKGTIYVQKDIFATMQTDDGKSIFVWFKFSDNELINVIENLD